jgi:hypothetical protein
MSRFYCFFVIKSSSQRRRRAGLRCNFFGRSEVPSDPNGNTPDAADPFATYDVSQEARDDHGRNTLDAPAPFATPLLSHLLARQSLTLPVASSPCGDALDDAHGRQPLTALVQIRQRPSLSWHGNIAFKKNRKKIKNRVLFRPDFSIS